MSTAIKANSVTMTPHPSSGSSDETGPAKVTFAFPRQQQHAASQSRRKSVDMSTQTIMEFAPGGTAPNGAVSASTVCFSDLHHHLYHADDDVEEEDWLLDPHQIGRLPPPPAPSTSGAAPTARLLHHSRSAYIPQHTATNLNESCQVASMRRASLASPESLHRVALYTRSKTQPLREHHIDGDESAPPPMPPALYRGIIVGLRFVYNFNDFDGGVNEQSEEKRRMFCARVTEAAADENLSEQTRYNIYCRAVVSTLLTQDQINECRAMQNLSHDNVNFFIGAAFTFSTENSADSHNNDDGSDVSRPPPITALLAFQHCPRSTLASVLRSYDEVTRSSLADWQFRQTLVDDIVHGLQYLHQQIDEEANPICFHGRLSSDSVVLDWRWCAKLTDFGMWSLGYADGPVQWLRQVQQADSDTNNEIEIETAARKLLWVAPEIMRVPELFIKATTLSNSTNTMESAESHGRSHNGSRRQSVDSLKSHNNSSVALLEVHKRAAASRRKAVMENVQKADIYALGIIMSEIVYQCSPPYSDTELELREVIDAVKCGIMPKPDGFNSGLGQHTLFPANNYLNSSRRNSLAMPGAVKNVLRPCHEPLPSDSFDNNRSHQTSAERYRQLMQLCWREAPNERPDMAQVSLLIDEVDDDDSDNDDDIDAAYENGFHANLGRQTSEPLIKSQKNAFSSAKSVVDPSSLQLKQQQRQTAQTCRKTMHKLDKYAHALESLVERRTRELLDEKQRADELLARLMPIPIAERLKRGEPVEPEHFDACTVFFSDVVGFTVISERSTPMQVVQMLNQLYSQFDAICERYNVYKLETVGDAYIVISGVPVRHAHHAAEIAGMALEFQHLMQRQLTQDVVERRIPQTQCLRMRMGINTGPVVAAVIGVNMPRYSIFGDTMNVAARMESHGVPMKIQLSYAAKKALEAWPEFIVEERGMCNVKGKGKMLTYWLVSGPQTKAA